MGGERASGAAGSGGQAGRPRAERTVATNREARHEYFILETLESGIVLTGTEIKSVRAGRVNLKDSYAKVEDGQAFLYNLHISPYEYGNRENHDPLRTRKLLLHKGEIIRLIGKTREKGLTLVPLRLYLDVRGRAKVELALAKGKHAWDKREAIAEREARREAEREVRERQKYW
ncbi:MAG: SsrA-binding protein SmpB [Bacillota bacterium]|nr:SsrA-binding protein SmpB [Bacillota bacterium]